MVGPPGLGPGTDGDIRKAYLSSFNLGPQFGISRKLSEFQTACLCDLGKGSGNLQLPIGVFLELNDELVNTMKSSLNLPTTYA